MNVLLMLLGVVIVYVVISKVYSKYWNKELDVSVFFDKKHCIADESINLTEIVTNAKLLPLPYINLKFEIDRKLVFDDRDDNSRVTDKTYRNDVFSLLFNQKITRRIPIKCSTRGVYRLDEAQVVFSGAFMSDIMISQKDIFDEITVYPKVYNPSEINVIVKRLIGEVERNKYLLEDKFVFRGIRDYENFDSLRDINWKASAKTGELMVNQYNETTTRKVCILLNLEPDGMLVFDELSEKSISVAAGFAQALIEEGISVSLVSNGCDIDSGGEISLQDSSDYGHLDRINTALARIDLKKEMRDFIDVLADMVDRESIYDLSGFTPEERMAQFSENSDTIYVVISQSKRKKLQEMIALLTNHQNEVTWILPYHPGQNHELIYCDIKPEEWEVDYV